MSEQKPTDGMQPDAGMKLVYWLTVAMVSIGLINMTPGIPGYDNLAASITGIQGRQPSENSPLSGFIRAFLH